MRSEKEMFELILGFAEQDRRVRAVVMNGSRANPQIKKDLLQDFDIVYLVDDYESFMANHRWIDVFGEKLVYQLPDAGNCLYDGPRPEGNFGYLMQFTDGNRIDLTLAKKELYRGYCFNDRLSVVLLDKDNMLPPLPPPDESSHYIQKPSQAFFDESRCEFWWVSPYVAKGLWRGQLLFAQKHMEWCVRKELERMLSWLAGGENGYSVSAGKCGDKLKTYLPSELWEAYLKTYGPCEENAIWEALFQAGTLFTKATKLVAAKHGFRYDDAWDKYVPRYLRYLKGLRRDAKTMDFDVKKD